MANEMTIKEKLMHIQHELKAPKNLRNNFGGYNYRNAESILEALKPLLAKYGATVTITDTIEEIGGRIYVKAMASIWDIERKDVANINNIPISVEAYARESETKKGMDDAQITGATSSYARKYALNGLFLLDDTQDVDTEADQARTELREYLKKHGIDGMIVAQACNLNKNSTHEDFVEALAYAMNLVKSMGGVP